MQIVVQPFAERLGVVQKLKRREVGNSAKPVCLVFSPLAISDVYDT